MRWLAADLNWEAELNEHVLLCYAPYTRCVQHKSDDSMRENATANVNRLTTPKIKIVSWLWLITLDYNAYHFVLSDSLHGIFDVFI